MYEYKAKVLRVVDADTSDVEIDLGFDLKIFQRLRFYGIDTPESRTRNKAEKKLGLAAKEYVKERIEGKEITLTTTERGKFGRYLAIVYYEEPFGHGVEVVNLNKRLIEEGHAKEYFGGKKVGWDV